MLLLRKPIPHAACTAKMCRVPPSPDLIARLLKKYEQLLQQQRIPKQLTFKQFFDVWICDRRGEDLIGLDDGSLVPGTAKAVQLITRPKHLLQGTIRTLVLLVDFDDQPHDPQYTTEHYERMLFGDRQAFPSGSMREYYRGISNFDGGGKGVDIQGQVHGWFRLPKPLSFYADGQSGLGNNAPRNAMGMARDAVDVALANSVDFSGYDAFGEKLVTALFIVHAGRGAEESGEQRDIWSHKAVIDRVQVAPNISVATYLTVPEDSRVGVCAHEWGHLAARWADYYDTGGEDNARSNGLGHYCLMASGSWANRGDTPTLPTAMLRHFHQWIKPTVVERTTRGVQLLPAAQGGGCVLVNNPAVMAPSQYILLEYRQRSGQDKHLPDEGVAVYVIDEKIKDVNNERLLAIELIQADGNRDLAGVFRTGNNGDENDLYPFGTNCALGDATNPRLLLSDQKTWSGVTLTINGRPGDSSMSVDVEFEPVAKRNVRRGKAKGAAKRAVAKRVVKKPAAKRAKSKVVAKGAKRGGRRG